MDKKSSGMTPAALIAALNGDVENAIVASTPGGIEAQEAAGQRSFVGAETLPLDMRPKDTAKAILESLGFEFGGVVNRIFLAAKFPPGWKKVAESHSMWSHLEDPQGRDRASIFFKAAFYDYNAHLYLATRYEYGIGYGQWPEVRDFSSSTKCYYVWDKATDTILFHTGQFESKDYDAMDRSEVEARKWLDTNLPDWRNPAAYWD